MCPWYDPSQHAIYLFKISHWNRITRCENYLTIYSMFIVNCSLFVVNADSERAKACWVHIENTSTFDNKIGYIMRHLVVKVKQNSLINRICATTSTNLRVRQWKVPAKEFVLDVDSGYKDEDHIQNNLYIFFFTD